MTCKYSHMEIGKTYMMNVDARCCECEASIHIKTPMIYQGHGNIKAFGNHSYYGDYWKETPPISCPNYCEGSSGYFAVPCSKGLADELFKVADVPVDAVAKVTE